MASGLQIFDQQLATTHAIWVRVAEVRGSAPREPGARMLVSADGLAGTIGGGNLEFKAIEIARALLAESNPMSGLHTFPLGPRLGQCCGGVAELIFEPVNSDTAWLTSLNQRWAQHIPTATVTVIGHNRDKLLVTQEGVQGNWADTNQQQRAIELARAVLSQNQPHLYPLDDLQLFIEPLPRTDFHIDLYGAGHVGKALMQVLSALPCHIRWIDSRAEQFPETVPGNVEIIISDAPELEADDASAGCYALIMTHSHPLDQAICERYLKMQRHRYLGLIGSAAKKRKFEQRLRRQGVTPAQWDTLTCPIGIAGIDGKHPAEIAIAVAAELLQLRQQNQMQTAPKTAAA